MDGSLVTARDELNLSELAARLLRGWYLILACLLVALGLALGWLHYTPKIYIARMMAAAPQTTHALSDTNALKLYAQGLTSRGLAAKLAARPDAVAALSAATGRRIAHPTGEGMQNLLNQTVKVVFDPKVRGAVTVTMTARNGAAAAGFLAMLHAGANDYIAETMDVASPVTLFDPPYAASQPVAPRRNTVIRNALVLGLLAGAVLALARSSLLRLLRRLRPTRT